MVARASSASSLRAPLSSSHSSSLAPSFLHTHAHNTSPLTHTKTALPLAQRHLLRARTSRQRAKRESAPRVARGEEEEGPATPRCSSLPLDAPPAPPAPPATTTKRAPLPLPLQVAITQTTTTLDPFLARGSWSSSRVETHRDTQRESAADESEPQQKRRKSAFNFFPRRRALYSPWRTSAPRQRSTRTRPLFLTAAT